MTQSLFGVGAGGSFAEQLQQARQFAQNARVGGQAAAPVETEALRALAADIGSPAAQAAAEVATEVAAPIAQEAPDLAAAARAAAQASMADPAYMAGAAQQLDVVVQPRLIVQGQMGPTVIPVDVAVPAAHANVSIAPATSHVIDPAAGQAVAAQAAASAGESAASSPLRALRSMSAEDLGAMLGGRHARVGARPAATQAASEVVAEAAAKPGWRDQIAHALDSARGPAAATSTAGDVAEAVVKPGLLDRIRASAPDLAALRGPSGGAAATVAGEVAETAVKGLGASARSGLFAQLREAAELAAKIK